VRNEISVRISSKKIFLFAIVIAIEKLIRINQTLIYYFQSNLG